MIKQTAHTGVKLGYLVKIYPKLSETFILHEILALEQQGMALQIFALNQPLETHFHSLTTQVRAAATYIPSPVLREALPFLRAHLTLCLTNPRRYYRMLRFLIQRQEGERWEEFCQAGYLAWTLKHTGVTHLHVHFANKPAGVAELVHLLTGIPYSITAHAKDIYLSPPAVLDRKMHQARFVITCTEYNRRFLQDISTNGTPIYRIYHGLDLQRFQPTPIPGLTTEGKDPLILSVERLREKKGFPCLIQACHGLKERGYRFRYMIVGYGPLQRELEQLISTLGLDKVVSLLGPLTQDKLIALYRQAAIFALPCQIAEDGDRDGIPNVLVEAMAMQLPVVSTPVSGIPELITHMQHGLLVPPHAPDALMGALALLLEQPRLRQELGKAGRQKVCQQFSAEDNIAQIKALFVDALSSF